MAIGTRLPHARAAATVIAGAALAGDAFLGAGWASALAIGGRAGGAAAGLTNCASNLAGFVSPALMGWSLDASRDWTTPLTIAFSANALAAVLWLGVNPSEPPRRAVPLQEGCAR